MKFGPSFWEPGDFSGRLRNSFQGLPVSSVFRKMPMLWYVYIYICVCVHMYTCACIYMYKYMYFCIHVCVDGCAYVCATSSGRSSQSIIHRNNWIQHTMATHNVTTHSVHMCSYPCVYVCVCVCVRYVHTMRFIDSLQGSHLIYDSL